jgi:(p)ppGpp synthase/HD superfamily hydrolase
MAALLHDTVDDTRVSLNEIYDAFGPRVAQMVGQVGQLSTTTQLLRRRRRTDVSSLALHHCGHLHVALCHASS